ncbi:MAG: response regulator [Clostridium sp.]
MYKILAVDDMEIFLDELKNFNVWKTEKNFKIIDTATNGKKAFDLMRKKKYDVVFTDIRMPIMDGLQLLRNIKKYKLCKCVVLLSKFPDFTHAREGIVLGAFDYIVKPLDEKNLINLLERIKEFLDSEDESKYLEKENYWIYPKEEEKSIIKFLLLGSYKAEEIFVKIVNNLYNLLANDIIKADINLKRIYNNIINNIYDNLSWLDKYLNKDFFGSIDYLNESDKNSIKEMYIRKIHILLDFLNKFYFNYSDERIKEVCKYILENPDSDLKLKVISEKFYVNNAYLSNIFKKKLGIGFNEYITIIKMERAKYLLKNTNLKAYEIGYKLGYSDKNYFSKLFKSYFGKSPSESRSMEGNDYTI